MSYWPPGLPDPQTGNSFETAETRLQHEGDICPVQRICDPNYCQNLTLTWTLTETEYRVFESWFFHRLCDGVSRFEVEWDNRHGWARFTGNVQAQLNGANWTVSGEARIDYASDL